MSDRTKSREMYDLLERLAPGGAEDFITEAFCWILQQEGVDDAFLEFLMGMRDQKTPCDTITRIVSGIREGEREWSTQESLRISSGVKRLDMICNSETQKLIFEHKTWTRLHDNQLEDYREAGKKHYGEGNFAIILITARRHQEDQNPDLHFLWGDVYCWLKKWLRDNDDAPDTDAGSANFKFVCCNFLTLLEKRGLGPMPPIEKRHFMAFKTKPDADEGMRRLKILLKDVRDRWRDVMAGELKANSKMLKPSELEDKWGRIGFNFLEGWHPGIFIGVLHHGGDHRVKLLDGENGPDACVILDMDRSEHPEYWKNCHYKGLVSQLTEKWPINGPSPWQAYHHLNEPRPNNWHPVHIRRNLEDVLGGGRKSREEQVDAFFEAVKEVVNFVEDSDDFWNLRKDLASGE